MINKIKLKRYSNPLDLPLASDVTGRFLPWIIALMVFLSTLAAASTISLSNMTKSWHHALGDMLTVQIAPFVNGAEPAPMDLRIRTAVALLRGDEGVKSVKSIENEEAQGMLKPWLGNISMINDLPIPALIEVELNPNKEVDVKKLEAELTRLVPGATIDDHSGWLGELASLARSVQTGAVLIMILIAGATIATVMFGVRAGLGIHKDVVGLLHVMGASDMYIARQFQNHITELVIRGSIVGFGVAGLTLIFFNFIVRNLDHLLLPDFSMTLSGWILLLLLPAAAGLIAAITARLTVVKTLEHIT